MVTRVLHPSEYEKLENFSVSQISNSLPIGARVIVVEHEGKVVGTWSLIPYYHLECMEVVEAHRGKGKVARKLLSFMFSLLASLKLEAVITSCIDEVTEGMIKKLGGSELPGKHFALGIRKDF